MKRRLTFFALSLALPLGACRSNDPKDPTPRKTAPCAVCSAEGDMACMQVTIEPDTPTVTVDGKRYYFCSDECLQEFLKDPERYEDSGH